MISVCDILRTLGVGRRFIGHAIISVAVPLAVEDETRLYCVSRQLYPEVAAKLDCTVGCVERNIRTVIDLAWRNNPDYLSELAGYKLSQPPNVKQFLDILVTYLLREQEHVSAG